VLMVFGSYSSNITGGGLLGIRLLDNIFFT